VKYTAKVSRSNTFVDENLTFKITDAETLETFKQRVYDTLKVTDFRANLQQRRLFEDSDLVANLDYNDLKVARKAAEILYPLEGIPSKLDLGEDGAIEFSKLLSGGETLSLYLHEIESYDDLSRGIKDIFDIVDSRLQKTNKRELDFMEYFKNVPYSTRLKVSMLMDILFNKTTKEAVIERLKEENVKDTTDTMRVEALARGANNNV